MFILKALNSKLFINYSDDDPFTKSFAKFLFIISFFFFLLMFALFFTNVHKAGLINSLITSGLSCTSASVGEAAGRRENASAKVFNLPGR